MHLGMNVSSSDSPVWSDGSALLYENWAEGHPKNNKEYAHIQLQDMKWSTSIEKCLVLCVRTDGEESPGNPMQTT